MKANEILLLTIALISLFLTIIMFCRVLRYGKEERRWKPSSLSEEDRRQIIDGVGMKNETLTSQIQVRTENMEKEIDRLSLALSEAQKEEKESLEALLQADKRELGEKVNSSLLSMEKNITSILGGQDNLTKARMEAMEKTVEERLGRIEATNREKLEAIQSTVEEKLETSLSSHLKQSFDALLSELNHVTEAVGEIKTMSREVGALRNALTNVKMRGIIGEVVLGNLISDILTPDQYITNAVIKEGSRDSVEYAIRMPGKGEETVLLPVDSKFPLDDYRTIKEAMDEGQKEKLLQARKNLKAKVKAFAKDIHDKYIEVPKTTDFGIMFLPTESLYAEIADLGIMEEIQREYHIVLVSPSTFQALLNALQMGFHSVSIEKKSAEITVLLFRVKKQFDAFADTLSKTQSSLNKASDDLEKLVGTRTRMLKRQLDKMEEIGYFEDQDDIGME